jgi:hypothetical protein
VNGEIANGGSNRTSAAAIRQGALPVQNIGAQMPLGKSFRAAGGGVYLLSMTKLLGKAVETMRGLPAEMQDNLARMLLQLAGEDQPVLAGLSGAGADFGVGGDCRRSAPDRDR